MVLAITEPTDWTIGPSAPSPSQRALSAAVLERVMRSPILSRVNKHAMPSLPKDGRWTDVPKVTLAGSTALPTGYWAPRDLTAPAVPTPVTWEDGNDATPKEVHFGVRMTREQLVDIHPFRRIKDGTPVLDPEPYFDPVLAETLADALCVEIGRVFSSSADSNTDPVHPIAAYTGTTNTNLGRAVVWSDLVDDYYAILDGDRFTPSVTWTSPATYVRLRRERDSVAALIHDPRKPLYLDVLVEADGTERPVPVVPVPGFADTVTVTADARAVWAVFRETFPSLLIRIDRSDQVPAEWVLDRVQWRLSARLDFGIPEGMAGAVRTLTHSVS